MYEKILVPLDGSEMAEVAIPYAIELAGKLGHAVDLLYVTESNKPDTRHMNQLYLDKMVEVIKQGVMKEKGQTKTFKSAIVASEPAEGILEYADNQDVGLIVMGTHGRHGVRRWTLGSVAEKVVRATDRPVVLIRTTGVTGTAKEPGAFKKILVPLDGSKESETVISYIEEIAHKFQALVVLVQIVNMGYFTIAAEGYNYVVHSDDQTESFKKYAHDYLEGVARRFSAKGITTSFEVKAGNPAEEIIALADNIQADIVAMSTHARSRVGRWVFGSVAERVLYEGHCHLLLVRVPKNGK